MISIIYMLVAYVLGSIPNALYVGKVVKKIDVREHGSKNCGATNAYRVLGAKCGIAVLVLDIFKGVLPLYLASIAGVRGWQLVLVGVVAIVGHTFSFLLNFNGGKGVATSLGVFLYLAWQPTLIVVLLFIVIVYITKYVSLGSILAAAALPVLVYFLSVNPLVLEDKMSLLGMVSFVAAYVIYKHKTNIVRLIKGTESKINEK